VKRIIGNLLLLALVGAVASFFLAPAVAFFGIRSAAQADDVAGLQRLIDYGAVRNSLRPQLSGRAEALTPAPSFMEDPIGAVRRQFDAVTPVVGPDPDAFLTPDALDGLMRGQGRYAIVQSAATMPEDSEPAPMPGPKYWGINVARLAVTDEGGSETIFTFERRGPFEWKLVHIGLPDGATPAAPPQAPVSGVTK
jgi:hypothetical protein